MTGKKRHLPNHRGRIGASTGLERKAIMLKKHYYKGGKRCRVWFYLPAEVDAEKVHLVGDFNDWDEQATPMKQKKDGTFFTALTLDTEQDYQFKYLLDGERWENDWQADDYITNELGVENSVVSV